MTGPTGPTGPTGATGATGSTGQTGDVGGIRLGSTSEKTDTITQTGFSVGNTATFTIPLASHTFQLIEFPVLLGLESDPTNALAALRDLYLTQTSPTSWDANVVSYVTDNTTGTDITYTVRYLVMSNV